MRSTREQLWLHAINVAVTIPLGVSRRVCRAKDSATLAPDTATEPLA